MKTNETGRSMVEMLGVLAIIGVLSVAGIAGYTAAMKKNRVNTILGDISTTVILGKTSNGGAGVGSTATSASTLGYTVKSKDLNQNGGGIMVKASDTEGVYEASLYWAGTTGLCNEVKAVAPTSTSTDAAKKRVGYYVSCT